VSRRPRRAAGRAADADKPRALSLVGACTLRGREVEAKLVLASTPARQPLWTARSSKRSRWAWAWFEEIKAGATMQAIADRDGGTQRRVAHLVDLAFLVPEIVRSIVEGRQPPTLTADRLIKSRHRMLWTDQRAWLSGSLRPAVLGGEFSVTGGRAPC
jgi:site-specific DNA recombinase